MRIGNVISSIIKNGRRLIKASTVGQNIETPATVTQGPIDFVPLKNMKPIIANTQNSDTNIVVGYINKNVIEELEEGESAIYSISDNRAFVIFRNNGSLEINGNDDNMIRYSPLDSELQNFKNQLQQELTKIAAGISGAGGSYTPAVLTVDISDSKIDSIKTT